MWSLVLSNWYCTLASNWLKHVEAHLKAKILAPVLDLKGLVLVRDQNLGVCLNFEDLLSVSKVWTHLTALICQLIFETY